MSYTIRKVAIRCFLFAVGILCITLTPRASFAQNVRYCCYYPGGESTTMWNDSIGIYYGTTYEYASSFVQTVYDYSGYFRNFGGYVVKEWSDGDYSDGCAANYTAQHSSSPGDFYTWESVTGSQWTVGGYGLEGKEPYTDGSGTGGAYNTWGYDFVGPLQSRVTFYRDDGDTPCGASVDQSMLIYDCDITGFPWGYADNQLTQYIYTSSSDGVQNCRVDVNNTDCGTAPY